MMPNRATDNCTDNRVMSGYVPSHSSDRSPFETPRREGITGAETQDQCYRDTACVLHASFLCFI